MEMKHEQTSQQSEKNEKEKQFSISIRTDGA